MESVAPVKPTVTVAWMGGKDCWERHPGRAQGPSATTATMTLLVLASVLSAVCKIY